VLEAANVNVTAFCRPLATALTRLGDVAGAFALLRRAIREDPLGQRLAHGSDRERMNALELANANLAQYLDLFMLAGRDDPSMVEEACDIVLSRKALGAELLAAQRQAVAHSDDPQLTALMTRLAELRESSAQSSLAGMDAGETLIEIERVEWELASRVRGMDVTDRLPEFTHESAAALLPDASVLIEFVRFTRRSTISADPDALDDGTRDAYIAFVIPSGQGSVRLVDLGDAPGLDRLIQGYRSELTRPDSTADAVQGREIVRSCTRRHEGSRDALRARLSDPRVAGIG
jgi:hypothetical protein